MAAKRRRCIKRSSCRCQKGNENREQSKSCQCCRPAPQPSKQRVLLPKQPVRPPPTSDTDELALRLINRRHQLAHQALWLDHLPRRLGHHPVVDTSAWALLQVLHFYCGGQTHHRTLESAYQNYGKVIGFLRVQMQAQVDSLSDEAIISIALLAIFETVMRGCDETGEKQVYSHWLVLWEILQTRSKKDDLSEIVKLLLVQCAGVTFNVPLIRGQASPFDDECENSIALPLPEQVSHPGDANNLQRMADQMRMLRTGLISDIRTVRTSETADEAILARIRRRARRKYGLQDQRAENELLHRVKVVKTRSADTTPICQYSYDFKDDAELMMAVSYWLNRCATLNLCLELAEVHAQFEDEFDWEKLREEKERYGINIIMCWEPALSSGPFATLWIAKAFVQLWLQVRREETFRKIDTATLQTWMLPKIQHPFMEWLPRDSNAQDIDRASEFILGRPIERFVSGTVHRA